MKQTRSKNSGGTSTPMMKQYLAIKGEHPDAILFFRMGDFYEMFLDDAVVAAQVLKIALTTRDKGKDNAVPMCGIPYHAAQGYLTKLVQAGHKVAICEQVEDPALAKGLVRREVTRIVTPGTVVEETLLDADSPSYLAAVNPVSGGYGLALVEASTGEFMVTGFEGDGAASRLATTLAQYEPREVLMPEGAGGPDALLHAAGHLTAIEKYRFNQDAARETLKRSFGVGTLSGFGTHLTGPALGAAGAALWYLGEVHGEPPGHLKPPRTIQDDEILVLDPNTLGNLEILRSATDGRREGSLLAVMDMTVTHQGSRLLREMLIRPLLQVGQIDERLDLVEELVGEVILRGRIRKKLRQVSDIERIVARFASGTAGPRDAVSLAQSLEELPRVKGLLADLDSDLGEQVCRMIHPLDELSAYLENALVSSPPATLREGGVFREGHNVELDELRSLTTDGRKFLSDMEAREKEATRIPSLKIGFNRVFGYYLEVTNAHKEMVPEAWIRKQTLVSAERYITEELKGLEEKILSAQERMVALERELFEDLRREIGRSTGPLQVSARGLAMADVFTSLAELAHCSSYARPTFLEDDPEGRISITQGRHPVLEKGGVSGTFVPNDLYIDSGLNRMMIITGPNMAGKSTFMRQVALIAIMAQAGSFVPAREVLISPVDRVFTRVGASDQLARGLSTFMVEMVETAEILNNATGRSLVILDEIGRGTSTFDGISIAWAVAEELLEGSPRGCRTLFATHYHELTELALTREGVKNYNVSIREWGEKLVFLHRVQEGASDKSYGISVGKLAGLPGTVVTRAREILGNLESHALDREGMPVLVSGEEGVYGEGASESQMGLFNDGTRNILDMLGDADIDALSPLEALNLLARMKKYKILETDD
ncbi:MAG: DNA mismatch repair protein MutS [bacterium]|nr:DNA mismatch repair protein MutS [bacterium]MDT8396063.1 DNA mismatch repair protein MutS [bacterium]